MKKKLKVLLAIVSLVAIVASLSACGGSSSSGAASGSAAGSASSGSAEASGLKICIITSSGIDDGSFNQNCYEGIQAFIADHSDCTVTDIKESDYNELVPTVERLAGD